MPRKRKERSETEAAAPSDSKRVTPVDIQQKEFRLAFRGYHEREVDQFLDEVTEEVARLHAETKRLREELEFARTSRLDLAGAAEAEGILRRAREEAGRILSDARARASAHGIPMSGGRGNAGALAPFIAQEREFLQSLANLIQVHAESVKETIRRTREAAAAPAPAGSSPSGPSADAQPQPTSSQPREAVEPVVAGSDPDAGPPTQPWAPPGMGPGPSGHGGPAGEDREWTQYYASSPVDEPAAPDRADATSPNASTRDEIVDLTEDHPEIRRREAAATPSPEPSPVVRRADLSDDDSAEERSIRELFWGEE